MKISSSVYLIFAVLATVFSSCNREPVPPPEPVIDKVSIARLRQMFDAGVVTVDTNVYIQGIITRLRKWAISPHSWLISRMRRLLSV